MLNPSNASTATDLTFSGYSGRVFQQFTTDGKREVLPTVIAIIAIIVVLLAQYRVGWIKVGEGWATANQISPTAVGYCLLEPETGSLS